VDACVTMSLSKAPRGRVYEPRQRALHQFLASGRDVPRCDQTLRRQLARRSRPTSAWCSKLRTPADGKFRMLDTPKQHWRTTMALRTPLTRQQRARTSLQHHERTSVFRLIDAPSKPCHQNGIELLRRPCASPARSAPTRRWKRRAGTCHQHHKAVPMTDSSHSMNLRGARLGVSVHS